VQDIGDIVVLLDDKKDLNMTVVQNTPKSNPRKQIYANRVDDDEFIQANFYDDKNDESFNG